MKLKQNYADLPASCCRTFGAGTPLEDRQKKFLQQALVLAVVWQTIMFIFLS